MTHGIGEDHVMDRGFAVLIIAIVGGCIALQAPINAGLGKHTGSFAAATISFAVGTVLLARSSS